MCAERTLTVDGIEATFAVNHLSHFVLTQRLLPRLVESGPSRIITVASGRHVKGTMDFADIGFERGYQILRACAKVNHAPSSTASRSDRSFAGSTGGRRLQRSKSAAAGRGRGARGLSSRMVISAMLQCIAGDTLSSPNANGRESFGPALRS